MEAMFGDLLDALDKYYPAGFSLEQLEKNFNPKMLEEALKWGAIEEREIKGKKTGDVVLTLIGYTILNQIRLKKATDSLNNSIKEFDESSRKSSKRVIILTIVLGILALVQLIVLVVPLFTQA